MAGRVLADVVVVQTWVVAEPREPQTLRHYEILVVAAAIADRENPPLTGVHTTNPDLYRQALAIEGTGAIVSLQVHAQGGDLWLDALVAS